MPNRGWRELLDPLDARTKLVYYVLSSECGDPGGDGWVTITERQIERWSSLSVWDWDEAANRLQHAGVLVEQRILQGSRSYLASWRRDA